MNVVPSRGQVRLEADTTNAATAPLTLPQRRGRSPWIRRALVFVGCVILLDSLFGDRGLAQTIRARMDYNRAVASLEQLKAQNAALRAEVHRLTGDPAAIEAVAREELGLIRPGEILVVVTDLK